jgi:nucleoside-diphosphate-sugar epimerase
LSGKIARKFLPGNLPGISFPPGRGRVDENTPQIATTKKGRVRIAMEESYRTSGVQTIVLRAGNFIDPAGNGDIMSMLMMRDIKKGKITAAADPKTLQAYAYVPDWGRAAAKLADKRTALAQFEDIPFPGHAFTTADLQAAVSDATGRDITLSRFPWWIMTLLSPFWELAREMREMRYLYARPHQIGSDKFNRLLPDFRPTSLEEVMLAGLPADINPNKTVRPGGQAIVTN